MNELTMLYTGIQNHVKPDEIAAEDDVSNISQFYLHGMSERKLEQLSLALIKLREALHKANVAISGFQFDLCLKVGETLGYWFFTGNEKLQDNKLIIHMIVSTAREYCKTRSDFGVVSDEADQAIFLWAIDALTFDEPCV